MNQDMQQKAIEALDVIADKLGTGVEHFWPLFITEQYIDGIAALVGGASIITATFISFKFFWKCSDEADSFDRAPAKFLIAIMALIITSIGVVTLSGATKLLNPEYHALKAVLEMVK